MTSKVPLHAPWADIRSFFRTLIAAWTLWSVVCVIVMLIRPGEETIPYNVGWAGFALAFGLGTWSRQDAITAVACNAFVAGAFLVREWMVGVINWDETSEIPLMFLLAMLMVWQVGRRQVALADVTRAAEREVRAGMDREHLMLLTSHELRTPLTIARGYIELLKSRASETENRQDLDVVEDELDRLSRVSYRLIRMIRLQDDTASELVDMDQLLAQEVKRWEVVADRRWVLDAEAGLVLGSPERLRTGLDTLVENAIRYTSVGDTIRLVGSRDADHFVMGVIDAGVGLTDQQILAINATEQLFRTETAGAVTATETVSGERWTGLGLSIVQAVAHAHGGTMRASHAPEGGAAIILTFPLDCPIPAGQATRQLSPATVST